LRIVPDPLWHDAHARLDRARRAFGGGPRGAAAHSCRLEHDADSPYLLTGLGRCFGCGGTLIAMTRAHGRQRGRFYGCANNHKRGQAVCDNSLQIRQDLLDQAVIQSLVEILDEHVVGAAIDRALARLRAGQETHLDRRTAIERDLSLIVAREQRLVEGIARGDSMEPLLAQLKAEESRKAALTHELATVADLARVTSLETRRI
jgi:recombinase-like zinc beta ribbon protein